ncbi:hypothetical protein [Streptomyces sp. NPDC051098]|uniref:hypothetical protein n=1 Tax=Streptomyces sp. NPDC051098 TaxID=3155411 RepID=UPI00343A5E6D
MNQPLCSISISSKGGLVSIRDFGTRDHPEMITGEEEVLFLPSHMMVGTRPDGEGDVIIEVRADGFDGSGMRRVIDAVMTFHSSIMSISEATDPEEETLRLPHAGDWHMSVYAAGEPYAHTIVLVLDEKEWQQ